jgi:5-methylcytosine-specific restriction protein A
MSPLAPKHPCGFPGCPMLVDPAHRRCEKHRIQERKQIDRQRGSATRRGYDARWRAARKRFLLNHPICGECERVGMLTAATIVDHIIPHKGDSDLFWNESNWQALCRQCHNRKTATTDGIWGGGSKTLDRNARDRARGHARALPK